MNKNESSKSAKPIGLASKFFGKLYFYNLQIDREKLSSIQLANMYLRSGGGR